VRKDESLAHLNHVIHGVDEGETWLPPGDTGKVLRLLVHGRTRNRPAVISCSPG